MAVAASSAPSLPTKILAFSSNSYHLGKQYQRTNYHSPFSLTLPPPRVTSLTLNTSTQHEQDQIKSTQKKDSFLQIMMNAALGGKKQSEDITSVNDFDADLASEIEAALFSAGVTDACFDGDDIEDKKELVTLFDSLSNGANTAKPASKVAANDSEEKTMQLQNKASKPKIEIKLPPHTSLAQVMANQYSIDIASVPYTGSKITAADVEYYAFKLSQPLCTPEALQLAYTLGLDLNVVAKYVIPYSNNVDRKCYELKVNDIEQYLDNIWSIRMIERRSKNNDATKATQNKKLDALDQRMEKNMERLSQKAKKVADTVAEGIVQKVQLQVGGRIAGKMDGESDNVIPRESAEKVKVEATKKSPISNDEIGLFFVDMK